MLLLLSVVAPLFGSAHASATYTQDPLELASAITSDAGLVASAAFEMKPFDAQHAVSTTSVQSFPTAGNSFGVLSTSKSSHLLPLPDRSEPQRGTSAYDVSVLRIDLNVPASANCLALDFRFLTRESGGWGEGAYEDAFIAELNSWTWTTRNEPGTGSLWDPDNFALYPSGHPVVAARPPVMNEDDAAGTGYGLGTPLLGATTAISAADANGALPGTSSLYLSIFDEDDAIFDSAVYLDGLRTFKAPPGRCITGPRMFTTLTATPRYVEDTTVRLGELSARLTDRDGNGIAAKQLDFYLDVGHLLAASSERLCSSTTDANGWARCADPNITQGSWYEVRFEGDSVARPSRARGSRATIAGTRVL